MRVRSVADATFIVGLCKKGIAGGRDRWICTPIIEQCSFYFPLYGIADTIVCNVIIASFFNSKIPT